MKLAATVILVRLTFVTDYHPALRVLWALGACGAAFATAIAAVIVYQRFSAKPS